MAVALINAAVHPAAIPYFNKFPNEPIPKGFVTIDATKELLDWAKKDVKSEITKLTTLLTAITKNVKAGGDVVIVMHGNDAGLFIRAGGPGIGFNVDAMRTLVMGLEGTYEDDVMYKLLKLPAVKDWESLKAQIEAMQALNLNRVDLRACTVGKDADVMYYLTKLFNCAVCCAPKAHDFYARMDMGIPTTEAVHWKRWLDSHPGAIIQNFKTGRFARHHTITGTKLKIEGMADNQDAVVSWVAANLPKSNYSSGDIFLHGSTDMKSLIFAGDPRYRDNLVEALKGGSLPKVKVDVNAPIVP